ncbi:MAG TPA: caspase family protein [Myxococcota bacterium]|nr:caspase family protein [Myxococcota bacterium]HRY94036.1 caspase family protein [Myxococcota bacterium]HSA24465.1 caspase family protein [Myxococcota bacterium]
MRLAAHAPLGLLLGLLLPAAAPADDGQAPVRVLALLLSQGEGPADTPPLRYPARDVERVREVWLELSGLRARDCRVLRDAGVDELRAAMAAIDLEARAARAAGLEVLVLFYYAGHARADALLLGPDESLPAQELRAWLAGSAEGRRVGFLDACLPAGAARPPPDADGSLLSSFAADAGEREADDAGGSRYSQTLVTGLRGAADLDADGVVSLVELRAFLAGRAADEGDDGQAITLTRPGAGAGLVFPAELSGRYLIYAPEADRLVAGLEKAAGSPRRLALAPGRYLLKKPRADDALVGQLDLEAGREIEVRDEDMGPLSLDEDVTRDIGVLAAEGGLRLRYALRFGAEAFFDRQTRGELFHSSLQGGLELALEDLVAEQLTLAVDFLAGFGQEDARIDLGAGLSARVGVSFQRYLLGLALLYRWDWPWLGVYLGPRLTFLVASRSFHAPYERLPAQSLTSLCPGAGAGLAVHLGPIDVLLEGRVHYLYYHLDGGQSMGFGGAYLGLAYRP